MRDGYIICGTPRTGSTLLCDVLAGTRKAGNPDSFYRRQSISWWTREWNLPGPDTVGQSEFDRLYMRAAIKAGKGGTAIFGLRLMQENLAELAATLDRLFPGLRSDKLRFEKAFGNMLYLHLSREDKLAQAISLVKAEQSGLWHVAPDGSEVERLAPHAEPRYDFHQLELKVRELEAADAAWRTWFEKQGIASMQISYESLSVNLSMVSANICKELGVRSERLSTFTPGVAKLSDHVSQEWMRRYRTDSLK